MVDKGGGGSRLGRWRGRPVLAFILRSAVYIAPIAAAVVFSIWLSRILPAPGTVWHLLGWFALLIAASTTVLFVVDAAARKMLPLAALLNLTMVFPDRSPSRFRTALRSGSSVKNLKSLVAQAERLGEDETSRSAELVLALSNALNAHDPRTRGHAERVRAYTDMLAEELDLDEVDRAKLRWSSLLHDIGKLKVPAEILNKPGKLDDDEWLEIKRHPDFGREICGPLLDWLGPWAGAVGDHHERFDGNGYPNGKKGAEISTAGRVVCVADAYDVMTTARSYKRPMPASAAREELARHAGTQFDPEVVRAFLSLSMGRLRWVAGPLSWLAQMPFLNVAGVVQNVGTTVGVAAAAGTVSAAAIGAGLVDMPDDTGLLPAPASLQEFDYDVPVSLITTPSDSTDPPSDPADPPPPPTTSERSVVADDGFSVAGESVLGILANDRLLDGYVLRIVSDPGFGTIVVNVDGTVTYIPDPTFAGTDVFRYGITDPGGSETIAVVTVDVTDEEPVLVDDEARVREDGSIVVRVLANDTDREGLVPASVRVVGGPLNGTATVAATGRITYRPDPDYAGIDTLRYRVADTGGHRAEASVAITVTQVNDSPVPTADTAATAEDVPVEIGVLGNDRDVDDGIDAASLTVATSPSLGTATVSGSSIRYVPGADLSGADSFQYRICDRAGACAMAEVAVSIAPVNDAPVVPGPGPVSLTEDDVFEFDPLAGASDADGDTLSLSGFDAISAAGGTVVEGSLVYTPPANYTGPDSFSYTVTDGTVTVGTAVAVTVTDLQHSPVVVDIDTTAVEDGFVVVDPLWVASDADGDPLSIAGVGAPSHGTATLLTSGKIRYVPASDFAGSDAFAFTVSDGAATSTGTVRVTVTEVNDPPVAVADAIAFQEDAPPANVGVFANDGDVDGDALSIGGHTIPASGTATVTNLGGGVFRVQPVADWSGTAYFTYTVVDGRGGSDTEMVTITVAPVPDAPVASSDAVTIPEDSPVVSIAVLANDFDVDPADIVSFVSLDDTGVTLGTVGHAGAGIVEYQPAPDAHGVDVVPYTITDTTGRTASASLTVTVEPVPDAPEANDDGYLTPQDTALTVPAPGVLGNDTDHDGDSMAVSLVAGTSNGALTLDADGGFHYAPDSGFVGTDEFWYRAVDPGGLTSAVTSVKLTVNSGILGGEFYLGTVPDGFDGYVLTTDAADLAPASNPADPWSVADTDGDTDPGATLSAGDGDYPGGGPFATFSYDAAPTALELDGPISVRVWSSSAGFLPDESAHLGAHVLDCDAATRTDCTLLLEADIHKGKWNDGASTWVERTLVVGSLQHTVNVGRSLVVVLTNQHDDLWIAQSVDLPSKLIFTAANRPPVATPDAYPGSSDPKLLEDGGTVAIDLVGNDFDSDLDVDTFSIFPACASCAAPTLGTAAAVDPPGPTDADGTVEYTPTADLNGVDVFEYEICDTNGACSIGSVTITITPVNDEPSFTAGPDVTVLEDSGGHTIADWATAITLGPANESGQKIENLGGDEKLQVDLADPLDAALFRDLPEVDRHGDLKFRFEDDANGSAAIVVSLRDDGGTADGGDDTSPSATITLTADPVNDEPDFSEGPDITVLEDSGAYSDGSPWATAISVGPPNEAGQSGSFTVVTVDDPALFSVQPALDPDGFLTFTVAPDANGSTDVDLEYQDDGGTADGGDDTSPLRHLKIDVKKVNDEPSFVVGPATVTVAEDSGAYDAVWATAMSRGPADEAGQNLHFDVVAASPALFADGPEIDETTGRLTFTPAADASGTTSVSVTLRDNGGTDDGGDDTAPAVVFTIEVTAVNDPPVVGPGQAYPVKEHAPIGTVVGTIAASDLDTPITGFSIVGGDPDGVFAVDASGVLTVDDNSTLDFEVLPVQYLLQVTATDGIDPSSVEIVTVDVVDVVEAGNSPPAFQEAAYAWVLNRSSVVGDVVGVAAAEDPDGDPLGYSIAAQYPAGQFFVTAAGRVGLATPLPDELAVPPPYTVDLLVEDGRLGSDTATATITLTDDASDLALAAAVSPSTTVLVGSDVAITYDLDNNGPDASSASRTYTYFDPAEFTFVAGPSSPGCVAGGAGIVRCNFGALAFGASGTKTIVFRADVVGTHALPGRAVATSSWDPALSDNEVSVVLTVVTTTGAVDLAIDATAPPNPSVAADFTLTWNVRNHGGADAPGGPVVAVTLPAGVTFQSGAADNGPACTLSAPVVECPITPGIPSGGVESGSVVLRAASTGTKVIGVGVGPTDTIPANNGTSVTVEPL